MSDKSGVAASGQGENRRAVRCKPVNRQQLLFRSVDVEKLVEEDHPVRAIWELVEERDLSSFYAKIEAVEGGAGCPAWDPRVLISLWLYAYSQAVSSARELRELCRYSPAYQWLTGLEVINYHTLSDFRVEHQEALDKLFIEVLAVLSHEGLVDLERTMHDGMKVKACAADKSFRRQATLEEHLGLARQRVVEMGDPRSEEVSDRVAQARQRAVRERQERLESALKELKRMQEVQSGPEERKKVRASTTDPEARIMKHSHGEFSPGYNVQISTDAKAKVIVGVGVSQSAHDAAELIPAVERIEANLGQVPRQMVVDGGLLNQETIVEMGNRNMEVIGPVIDHASQTVAGLQKRGVAPEFFPEAFVFDGQSNRYTCPAGQRLTYQGEEKRGFSLRHRYRARPRDCRACGFKTQCCPGSQVRSLVRTEEAAEVRAFREKMETDSAKEIYKQRSAVAEFPHAWIKEKFGLRRFHMRGLVKVRIETLWACLTYNTCQWIRLCWKPKHAVAV
jgi:transposase